MRNSRFTEAQVIGILKQAEGGAKVDDLAREHGVSTQTIYNWRAKFGGHENRDGLEYKTTATLEHGGSCGPKGLDAPGARTRMRQLPPRGDRTLVLRGSGSGK